MCVYAWSVCVVCASVEVGEGGLGGGGGGGGRSGGGVQVGWWLWCVCNMVHYTEKQRRTGQSDESAVHGNKTNCIWLSVVVKTWIFSKST